MAEASKTNALMADAGDALATQWRSLQGKLRTARDRRRACATTRRIMDNPERYAKPGAVAKAAGAAPPGAERDWVSFFNALAELVIKLAPLFAK